MASFSFGDGNAKKLLAIPLYAAGRALTLLVPRARGRWVFGSAAGIADGALALWHETAARGHRAVWLIRTEEQARDAASRGIPHVRADSLRGLWLTARAEVVVVTHGFGDVNRYAVSGSYLVQLWHGIPLKRIGIDSPETLRSSLLPSSRLVRGLLACMYRSATRRIRLLPAASHLVRGRLESAFSLDDSRVPVVGEPRVDVLSRGSAAERRESARGQLESLLGPLGDDRLVLYAPTWRDGDEDPAIPTAADWVRITAVLDEHDARLIVRPHPLGAGEYAPPSGAERVHLLGSEVLADVTPVLAGMDLLVTDYSSLAYDSSLVPLPVVYFAPDVDDYARRRGFYGTYADVAGTDVAADWEAALAQIAAVLSDDDVRRARLESARRLDAVMHAHRDGRNAERVYRAIMAAIGDDSREETA
ncbi:CDP-glycerol glycerophosphotransferase family protein [Microbacterium sp. Clip185]|uniref:CDP-glycerol glycerophosphotransferase family protein n=1 Tax=Microbacterium sp. Clip185 TaxID=3025663 RepID=UPI0023653046|nr:CDP-glycerol glycerophosphotransferase family protein [Microbacterium sp. Clip185]WDG16900.1 CDP-glycerol glycerophosphotransferase family protein [Microbacterium sp. Clip185]